MYPTPATPDEYLAAFGAALAHVDAALDWEALGAAYCHEGGEGFFTEGAREAAVDAALRFAADLGELLVPGGRSLYLGAGVAELPLLVFEQLVLGREVVAVTLDGPEPAALNAALALAEAEVGVDLPRLATTGLDGLAPGFDHLWLVSVLTDPDAFPALHDALYERHDVADGATGRGHLADDRARARVLVGAALALVTGDAAVLSTTDEEWTLVGPLLRTAGRGVVPSDRGRLSPIVGDVVRHVTLEPAP